MCCIVFGKDHWHDINTLYRNHSIVLTATLRAAALGSDHASPTLRIDFVPAAVNPLASPNAAAQRLRPPPHLGRKLAMHSSITPVHTGDLPSGEIS
jgi:hypothetical protein